MKHLYKSYNPFIRRKVVPGRRVTLTAESTLSSFCMTKTLPRLTELTAGQDLRHRGGVRGVRMPPPRSQKGPLDGIVKDFKRYKNNVGDGRIDNFSAFQQFENLKFLIFFRKEHAPGSPKNPSKVANHPELGGLLENPESRFDFSRNTSILRILKNSSHKPKSRDIYFCKIIMIFVMRLTNRLTWIPRRIPSCSHDE